MTQTEHSDAVGDEAPRQDVLRLEDLHVSYKTAAGPVPAVRGVDLTLPAGGRLGLAGESGCGKSTLAGAVLRLLPKSAAVSGRILLDGEDVQAMTWGRLRAVRWAEASIVFQGAMHSLNPVRRVGDQIAEPILLHDPHVGRAAAERRVATLLDQVGLVAARASAYPHELSGGQRQRVMIAMALACSPRLIVADEPTTALDVMIQAQILRLIGELVSEHGISLLMISHDLAVLAEHCDQLAVMYAGRIAEQGPADEVFTDAAAPVRPSAGRGLPTDRRRGLASGATRPAGRSAGPGASSGGLHFRPALRDRRG